MITCVIGLPRQGKSTEAARLAQKAIKSKRYDRVYCNFHITGCYKLDCSDLGKYNYENCLILIDEAMNEFDSRDFKKFTSAQKYFFSNHGHFKIDIVYFTQAYDDVDKKIRNLTQELYHVRKFFWWSLISPIKQILTIDNNTHQIVTGYKFSSILRTRIIFRPKYYNYFDTLERKTLPELPEHLIEKYPDMRKKYKVKIPLFPNTKKIYKSIKDITQRKGKKRKGS